MITDTTIRKAAVLACGGVTQSIAKGRKPRFALYSQVWSARNKKVQKDWIIVASVTLCYVLKLSEKTQQDDA